MWFTARKDTKDLMKVGKKLNVHVRIINRDVIVINGKYVIRTSNGWIKQIGVYTEDELAALHRVIAHMAQ